jgi:hypothetical protein
MNRNRAASEWARRFLGVILPDAVSLYHHLLEFR